MEQNMIFVPGNLRAPAEYFPVPVYFENAKWRLVSNAVWLGVQVVVFFTLFVFSGIALGVPLILPPLFLIRFLMIALPAVAMAVIFANGSLDLSVGSVCGLVSIVVAKALVQGVPPVVAVLLGLLVALLFGSFNAAAVGIARVPGFLVTFVVSIVARYLMLLTTEGKTIVGFERIEALPFLAVAYFLILAAAAFAWTQWPGVNARLAQRGGNATGRLRLALPFVVSALTAGTAGLLLLWRVRAGTMSGGMNLELQSVLVVALAGTCFYGRYVNVVGILIGAFGFAMLESILSVANVDPAVASIVTATLLALAVGFTYFYHFIVGLVYRSAIRKKEAAPEA